MYQEEHEKGIKPQMKLMAEERLEKAMEEYEIVCGKQALLEIL